MMRKSTIIPVRYLFTFVAFLGMMATYMMRACLSLAITRMVSPPSSTNLNSTTDSSLNKVNIVSKGEVYHWDEKTQGMILSSFYWGYIITHIPGGSLSQKFGGKYTFGFGVLSTAIFTLVTPFVVHEDPTYLIIVRFLEGVGEGVVFPALYILLAQWAPPGEKGVISTLIFLGGQVGTFLSNLIGGYILQYAPDSAWKLIFFIFGGCGIIFFILWQLLCYNDPLSHPFISEEEKIFLQKEIGCIQRKKDLRTTPWRHILTSGPVWALVISEIGHDWGIYTIIADLPKYINDVLKFNPLENGIMSGLPYLSLFISSCVSSSLNDWLQRKNIVPVGVLRKTFATISSVGPAIGMLCASYVQEKSSVSLCFVIGMGTLAFSYSSIKINALDLSPNYSGSIMGLVNGAGCISGMLAPYSVGLLTANRNVEEWRIVFWIMASILVFTNFVFVIFGSCKLQSWNDLDRQKGARDNEEKY